MAAVAELIVKITTDTKAAQGDLDATASRASRMGSGMRKAAAPAAAALLAVGAAAKVAVDSASRTQQAFGALDSVFGDNAATVKRWADNAAESVGLAASEYAELSSVIGAQLKNMGVPMDQVAKKTKGLVSMGADLSATFGGSTAEAVSALSSALRGETDPIERYGISIKQADIAARQAADGTAKLEGEAGKQAKTAALLAMVTEQSADAQGQFARESDSAAGSAQITAAKMENLKSQMGEALLPVVSSLAETLGGLTAFMSEHATVTQVVVGVIAGLAAAILLVNVAMAAWSAVTAVATAAQWLWNAAMAANPIGLVILGIIALVAAVVLAYNKVGWFRAGVDAAFAAIKSVVLAVARALVNAWESSIAAVRSAIRGVSAAWDAASAAVRSAVSAVVGFVTGAWSGLTGFVSSAWAAAMAVVSAAVRAWWTVASGIFGAVQGALSTVWDLFSNLGDRIKGLLGSAKTWLVGIGKDIVQGLIDGINSMVQWVANAVQSLADKIPGWVKKRLGIASPSKVMKRIGQDIDRGLVEGMAAGAGAIQAMSESVAGLITSTIDKATKSDKKAARLTAEVVKGLRDEYAALRTNAKARAANNAELVAATKVLEDLQKAQVAYADSVAESARDFASVTNLPEEATDAQSMLDAMRQRVLAVEEYNAVLARLRASGLAQGIIDDLAQAGVEGGLAQAQAIAAGGPAAIAGFNALQASLDLSAAALGQSTAASMYDAGIAAQQGIVDGLLSDQEALTAAAEVLAERLATAIRRALRRALRHTGGGGGGGGGADTLTVPTAPSVSGFAAPSVPSARTGGPGTTSGGINIVVNGAVDPESTARQIRRILAGHDRRVGLAS